MEENFEGWTVRGQMPNEYVSICNIFYELSKFF